MSKPRYFKFEHVTIYVRLDSKDSNPYITLNGNTQFMEDQMGNVFVDVMESEAIQITKKEAPGRLK